MKIKQVRTATELVIRECFPPSGGSIFHVIDDFLNVFVCPTAFNSACEFGASVHSLEFLRSRTTPDWKEAMCSAARGGQLHVLCWASDRQDGCGAWPSDFGPALETAASHGHLEIVKWLYQRRLDWKLNAHGWDKPAGDIHASASKEYTIQSALMNAAQNGHLDVVKWLFGIWPDKSDALPLHTAISNGHLEVVKWLYHHTTNIEPLYLGHPMGEAAGGGHLGVLQWLFENSNVKCSDSATHLAASNGLVEVLKWLYAIGMQSRNPLRLEQVAEGGHLHVLQWLYENELLDFSNMAACPIVAASNGRLEVLQWLHKHFPKIFSRSMMDSAAENGHLDVVKWLHAKCNERCSEIVIYRAACRGYLELLEWIQAKQNASFTGWEMNGAAAGGQLNVVRWLNENGCECPAEAMHWAAQNGHLDVFVYLVENTILRYSRYPRNPSSEYTQKLFTLDNGGGDELVSEDNPYRKIVQSLSDQGLEFFVWCLRCLAYNAFESSNLDILDWLSQFNIEFNSAIWLNNAVRCGDWKLVDWFHRHGLEVCDWDPVELAVRSGHVRLVIWFHERGYDVISAESIALAAQYDHITLVRWMIENGNDLNVGLATRLFVGYAYSEVVWYLSESERLLLVLKAVRTNQRKLLWWILASTWFELEYVREGIRNAIQDKTGIYEWLLGAINITEARRWLFPAGCGEDDEAGSTNDAIAKRRRLTT